MRKQSRSIRASGMWRAICSAVILLGAAGWLTTEAAAETFATPIGWAVVPGNGVESTTGGGNGDVVVATSASELSSYAGSSLPLTIRVQGTISGSGMIDIASNKTIVGIGSDATLSGVGLSMNGVSNIIIRNLTITGVSVDAIATRDTHHVWMDHLDVSDCGDGLIDITNQSDFQTVSWTRLSNHDKTMLINSGTGKPEDSGKLNTTLHHNWWDGTNQRNPRAGYGKIHIFNNLYDDNASYGVGLHSQTLVLVERNYFENVDDPIHQMYRDDPADPNHGFAESVDNIFVSTSGDIDDEGISFPVDDYYMYGFALDAAADVPSIVEAGVGPGAQFGELGLMPIPGNGVVEVSTNPTLRWTKGQSATDYIVSLGTTFPPLEVEIVSGQSYEPTSLSPGSVYYWRVDQVTPEGTAEGEIWTFRTVPEPGMWALLLPGVAALSVAGRRGRRRIAWGGAE